MGSTRRLAAGLATATLACVALAAAGGAQAGPPPRVVLAAAARAAPPPLALAARRRHRPRFVARVRRLSSHGRRTMRGVSWRPGCPVGLRELRVIRMRYWGFDRRAHMGRLIVNADVARGTLRAFRRFYAARFPLRRMVPVDVYGGSDRAAMAADDTSAFNCRRVTGSTDRWSDHASGRAIDVDPVENPYVKGSTVLPRAGRAYLDRSHVRRGMVVAGGVATRAFEAQGFRWGGDYTGLEDYQHFERPAGVARVSRARGGSRRGGAPGSRRSRRSRRSGGA